MSDQEHADDAGTVVGWLDNAEEDSVLGSTFSEPVLPDSQVEQVGFRRISAPLRHLGE